MFDLQDYLESSRRVVNTELGRIFLSTGSNSRINEAMAYSITAGGKRVRPALCMAAAEAVGASDSDIVSAACAIEMIHTYSLIHDDLPAMDNDGLRRGRPTCHVAFDEATAILAGDALSTLAFQTIAAAAADSRKDPGLWIEVINILAAASGHQGMIEGQMQDIEAEKTPLTLEQLEQMHTLKTGAMIVASVKTGAILGGGSRNQIRMLGEYAGFIGLAFPRSWGWPGHRNFPEN